MRGKEVGDPYAITIYLSQLRFEFSLGSAGAELSGE